MNWLRRFLFRLRAIFQTGRIEGELSEEIRLHLEMQTEANVARGMTYGEARDAARREFGGIDQVKELYRDERRLRILDDCWRDLRHSMRSLHKEKAFTGTVLAIFALCVAANVAIFSIVNGVLIRPLPFPDAEGILTVFDSYPKAGVKGGVSVPHYIERNQQITAFAEAAAIRGGGATLGDHGSSEGAEVLYATPSFFPLLRAQPALGRTFTGEEGELGHSHVAILSDALWHDRYNADPSVLGKSIRIDDVPHIVVGVMPPGFGYPTRHPRLWLPLVFTDFERLDGMRHANSLDMIVRLRRGVTVAQAQAQLDALNRRTLKQDPGAKIVSEVGFRSNIASLHSEFVEDISPVLLRLQAGAVFLLLIGALNLANLLVVRATGHAKEYGVRRALGAGPFRLGRALVLENLMLSVAGGLLGLAAGAAGVRATLSRFASRLPFEVTPGPDFNVCAVTLAASVLFGLLLALPVVWHTLRGNLLSFLSSESRSGTTARVVHRFRHTLIVTQIALAFALLSGTGMLALSLSRVLSVDPGFEKEKVLTGIVSLPNYRYSDEKRRLAFVERLVAALRASPGISSAGIDSGLPFTWGAGGITVQFKSHPLDPGEAGRPHPVSSVAGDLFPSLGIPLVQGRLVGESDVETGRMVCVVDSDFARRYWPKGDALGHGITPDMDPHASFFTIVGVVRPVKQHDLTDLRADGAIYLPYGAVYFSPSVFMVTLRASPSTPLSGAALAAIIARIDPEVAPFDVKTMSDRVDESLAGRRISLSLAALYAGAALFLAAIGIYGVLAYSVAQRQREIGIRMALGARPDQIRKQFLRLGFRLVAMGLPLGCAGAWIVARTMADFLYGVGPANLVVLGSAALALGGVAMVACLVPSLRAAHVAPAEALHTD